MKTIQLSIKLNVVEKKYHSLLFARILIHVFKPIYDNQIVMSNIFRDKNEGLGNHQPYLSVSLCLC